MDASLPPQSSLSEKDREGLDWVEAELDDIDAVFTLLPVEAGRGTLGEVDRRLGGAEVFVSSP